MNKKLDNTNKKTALLNISLPNKKFASDCKANDFTGYDAVYLKKDGSLYGIRTRVAAVKGRCPRPLDEQTKKRGLR